MDTWSLLGQIVLLLAAATVLGLLAQRVGQNAVIGYLLSGVLLGRYIASFQGGIAVVQTSAEIGVALLLFTIGLEFSLRRLRALGARVGLLGGLQILGTTAVVALGVRLLGLPWRPAVMVGLAAAMSSTSVALRLITDRSELDSAHGRAAVGVLLLQDLAVIPAMLVIPLLAGERTASEGLEALGGSLAKALLLLSALYALMRWLAPVLVLRAASRQNRDLPVLVSAVVCLSASWASHSLGLSAVLGAFAAGLMLAGSLLADQIRADVIPLRAAFLPLFFSSIGMLAIAPGVRALLALVMLAAGLLAAKALVIVLIAVPLRIPPGVSIRAGLALAQIGEFSFVLLGKALGAGLLDETSFRTMVGVTVLTLLLSPGLMQLSPILAEAVEGLLARRPRGTRAPSQMLRGSPGGHVVLIGFGPAGRQVAEELREHGLAMLVIDSNPKTAAASSPDLPIEYGDAGQQEILERADLPHAKAVVVTVPDPATTRRIIAQVRRLNPAVTVIVRARYHIHQDMLREAGAHCLVSEEVVVGRELAAETLAALGRPS